MGERLVERFGTEIPRRIAAAILAVHPAFPARAFLRTALAGYQPLDLMARGRHIASALRRHLPPDFAQAADILVRSLGPPLAAAEGNGMAPFLYLPHALYVAECGLDHFEESMRAQCEITQRFTAEFSIRPFIERHPEKTLERLREWARHPSPHVRRLVSEGTRPRLPWAPRLRRFQQDPRPVIELLELLKDDPDPYVRRSVANNLNDIGKDHPALLHDTARAWLADGGEARRRLVSHALRSAVKRGEAAALDVLGFGAAAAVKLRRTAIVPAAPRIGGEVSIGFDVVDASGRGQRVLVDLRIHFVKAGGRSAPRTFKLRAFDLAPGGSERVARTVSLAQLTTRRHYPGVHRVEALCNGRAIPLGSFELKSARRSR